MPGDKMSRDVCPGIKCPPPFMSRSSMIWDGEDTVSCAHGSLVGNRKGQYGTELHLFEIYTVLHHAFSMLQTLYCSTEIKVFTMVSTNLLPLMSDDYV